MVHLGSGDGGGWAMSVVFTERDCSGWLAGRQNLGSGGWFTWVVATVVVGGCQLCLQREITVGVLWGYKSWAVFGGSRGQWWWDGE